MKPIAPSEAAGMALKFFKLKEQLADMREKLKKERLKVVYLEDALDRERTIDGDERMKMALEEIIALKRANAAIDKILEGRIKDDKWRGFLSKYAPPQLIISKRLHREIVFHLHPDRWESNEAKQRAEKCLQEFNALKSKLYEEDS
jgi:hypothetical protein